MVSELDLAEAAMKVERGAKAELKRADIHNSYLEPTQSEVGSEAKENAGKPVQ